MAKKTKKQVAKNKDSKETEPSKKRFGKKFLVISLLVLLLVIAGAGAAWFFFLKGPDKDETDAKPSQAEDAEKRKSVPVEPRFKDVVELEIFELLDLKPSGNMKAITLEIALELENPGMRQEIEANILSIRKIIETQTSEMTWLDLRAPEGKITLKLKLIKSINQSLATAKIRDLFFTNLTMQ